jgi:hypothetical protein
LALSARNDALRQRGVTTAVTGAKRGVKNVVTAAKRGVTTVVMDAKRGVKEKVANSGEKRGARWRRGENGKIGENEDPVLN